MLLSMKLLSLHIYNQSCDMNDKVSLVIVAFTLFALYMQVPEQNPRLCTLILLLLKKLSNYCSESGTRSSLIR